MNRPKNTGREITQLPEAPWALTAEDVVEKLAVDPETGLSRHQAAKRRSRFGANRLAEAASKPAWSIFLAQWKNLIVLLLLAAAGLAFGFGQWLEGFSILIAVGLNTLIGFFTELKAVRSMEAIKELGRSTEKVVRNGRIKDVPDEVLVPGDIVVFEGGDVIGADIRVVEANRLAADESALTGESVPVAKSVEPVAAEAVVAERASMIYKGTAVTSGSGKGVVVFTGSRTELGRISELTGSAESARTPLEKKLTSLGQKLIWVTLAVAGVVAASGIYAHKDTVLIIETSIALAVAAIPEGLPVVATMSLAFGMWRMARRNAIIRRLSAVETLGATTVICTDKTGTLTENRLELEKLALFRGAPPEIAIIDAAQAFTTARQGGQGPEVSALLAGVLCNNAQITDDDGQGSDVGDPLEIALLKAGRDAGLERSELLAEMPEEREEAFDPKVNMMATIHKQGDGYFYAVKGAPESVAQACSNLDEAARQAVLEANKRLALDGYRVLAAAGKVESAPDADTYANLKFYALFGLLDPPREGVREVVEELRQAGITPVMITGDQPATAAKVGRDVGIDPDGQGKVVSGEEIKRLEEQDDGEKQALLETRLFARVSPEDKLALVDLFQKSGHVVAMTGDGVNDAPALKKADIGIAMGRRGTEVAREAADMVLKDDAFSTIAQAVIEGRVIFSNIRRFIVYLLSGNVGEIMIVGLALLLGWTLPLLPLQILYLNMIGDVFPALALAVGKGDRSVRGVPPRDPQESILPPKLWGLITLYGAVLTASTLIAFSLAGNEFGASDPRTVTVSFMSLAFGRIWHTFNMRSRRSHLFINDVTKNPYVWIALAICTALLLLSIYVPPLAQVLGNAHPGLSGWTLIIIASLAPLIVIQAAKIIRS